MAHSFKGTISHAREFLFIFIRITFIQSFSLEEYHNVQDSTTETSAGYDRITYSMVKNCSGDLQHYILYLSNQILYERNIFSMK